MVKGLYVHIPFCSKRCPYCDFYSLVESPVSPEEYVDILLKEADLYRDTPTRLETLYLGGGTPSRLRPEDLSRIVEGLSRVFDLSSVEEVTVECNPEDYGKEEFRKLRDAGFTRVSLGVQSFTEKGLSVLGRTHTPQRAIEAVLSAMSSDLSVNVDLIYGYPGQEPGDLEADLKVIEYLRPDHVSAYLLTPYEGTPLGSKILTGELKAPDEDRIRDLHDLLWRRLKDIGYVRYEISNWAKPGKECKHNFLYWTMEEFVGLGVSAWGFLESVRYGNVRNIKAYVDSVLSGRRPVGVSVKLSEEDKFEEWIMLRLRLRTGIPENLVPDHMREFFEPAEEGLAIKEEFMILANEITADLMVYNSIGRR